MELIFLLLHLTPASSAAITQDNNLSKYILTYNGTKTKWITAGSEGKKVIVHRWGIFKCAGNFSLFDRVNWSQHHFHLNYFFSYIISLAIFKVAVLPDTPQAVSAVKALWKIFKGAHHRMLFSFSSQLRKTFFPSQLQLLTLRKWNFLVYFHRYRYPAVFAATPLKSSQGVEICKHISSPIKSN